MPLKLGPIALVLLLALSLPLLGCAKKNQDRTAPTPEAGYVVLTTQSVPLQIELSGRTTAFETADVRPQVAGVIRARRFQEGSMVRQGQTLYEIDSSLYRAAADQAAANLAAAQSSHADAQAKAARYKPLAAIEAVSKQDYTDAAALAEQTAAQIKQSAAALETARINLRFTNVPAPITGRIGRSMVTTGALVTNAQATPLTTIQRLDPIFVDIQQSSADLVALRQELSRRGGVAPASTPVQLLLENGSAYPHPGDIEFAEALVDASTGTVTLRARFPNPDYLLLPGMFVRARLAQAVAPNAILVPQPAVSRDPRGQATVMVVGPGNKAVLRTIQADRTVGDQWLVTSGLSAGEKVITEGLAKIKPGQTIRPVPAGSPPSRPPAGSAAGGSGAGQAGAGR
ncbi:MAG: efflux transporter, family, subunit [Phenylobacterium sp.]|nr:efflux transporter, family, subunit [Phenylobacterium sp.]